MAYSPKWGLTFFFDTSCVRVVSLRVRKKRVPLTNRGFRPMVPTVTDLLERVRDAQLLGPDQLASISEELSRNAADARSILLRRVDRGDLTPFQVDQLLGPS